MKTLELYNLKEESSKFFYPIESNCSIFGRSSVCRSYRSLAGFFFLHFTSLPEPLSQFLFYTKNK